MSRPTLAISVNGHKPCCEVMGFASAQPILRAAQFNAFAAQSGIPIETPVSGLPGMTETLIPFSSVDEFEGFTTFQLNRP
jgi:hypothetical protein